MKISVFFSNYLLQYFEGIIHYFILVINQVMDSVCSIVGLQQEVKLEKDVAQAKISRLRKYFLKARNYYQLNFGSVLITDPQNVVVRELALDCYEIICKQCGFGFRIFIQGGIAIAQKLHIKSPDKIKGYNMTQSLPFQIRGLIKIVDDKPNYSCSEAYEEHQNNKTVSLLMCYANKQILTQKLDFALYLE